MVEPELGARKVAVLAANTQPSSVVATLMKNLADEGGYRLVDTAGIRRKSKGEQAGETFSIIKTLQAIEHCQVAVIMIDASEGVTEQDASVLGALRRDLAGAERRGARVFLIQLSSFGGLGTDPAAVVAARAIEEWVGRRDLCFPSPACNRVSNSLAARPGTEHAPTPR